MLLFDLVKSGHIGPDILALDVYLYLYLPRPGQGRRDILVNPVLEALDNGPVLCGDVGGFGQRQRPPRSTL